MSNNTCNTRNGCGCNSCSNILGTRNYNGCQSNCGGCGSHRFPFPPMHSVCGTCPPGTRPCNLCGNYCGINGCNCNPCIGCHNGCGCGNNCGNNCGCGDNGGGNNGGGNNGGGGYAFFNSTGSTLTTGSIIPLRFVIGSGDFGRGTTGGTVSLDSGIYSVEYSLSASADLAGATITVTPEYLGALHPEYSRSFTTTAADQIFDLAGSFVINLPTDTTLSLNVTITEPDGATEATTLSDVSASMLIRNVG